MLIYLKYIILALYMLVLAARIYIDYNDDLTWYSDNADTFVETTITENNNDECEEFTFQETTDGEINPTINSNNSNDLIKDANSKENDEYLYVKSDLLNVRSGPGTKYDVLDTIPQNTRIHRIGICDNGWSKIDYNGNIAYVYSDYLSYNMIDINKQELSSNIQKETVLEEMGRRGNIGRLIISDVGVDVALFKVSIENLNNSQLIVDNNDSAAYMEDAIKYYGFVLIGDHRHQGFSAIKNSVPDNTIAIIDRGGYKEEYMCVNKINGYNGYGDQTGLFDLNGNRIAGLYNCELCMYTCNADNTITITFWKQVQF